MSRCDQQRIGRDRAADRTERLKIGIHFALAVLTILQNPTGWHAIRQRLLHSVFGGRAAVPRVVFERQIGCCRGLARDAGENSFHVVKR
jgi:hypothetical protein